MISILAQKNVLMSVKMEHITKRTIKENDYQILLEADFLVNMFEEEMPQAAIHSAYEKVFKTEAGKTLCKLLYMNE
jgi:hypothetical protein